MAENTCQAVILDNVFDNKESSIVPKTKTPIKFKEEYLISL
jgi:hypothetical protein